MQFTMMTNVLFALSTIVTLSAGSAVPVASNLTGTLPIDPAPMKWIGPSKGTNVTLYGTASEIATQLKGLDPHWVPLTGNNVTSSAFELAAANEGTKLCCPVKGQDWVAVNFVDMEDAANTIKGLGGEYVVQPQVCQRAACTNGAGVWVCNDTPQLAWEIETSTLAQYAQGIADCPTTTGNLQNIKVCGQQFNTNGWNIYVNQC